MRIPLGQSLLSSFKEEIISSASELLVGVIKNDSILTKGVEVIKVLLLGESDWGLDSMETLAK